MTVSPSELIHGKERLLDPFTLLQERPDILKRYVSFCCNYDGRNIKADENHSDELLVKSITSHGQVVILRQTDPGQFVMAMLDLAALKDNPYAPKTVFKFNKKVENPTVVFDGNTRGIIYRANDYNGEEALIYRTQTDSVLEYKGEINTLSDISTLETLVETVNSTRVLGRVATQAEVDVFTANHAQLRSA